MAPPRSRSAGALPLALLLGAVSGGPALGGSPADASCAGGCGRPQGGAGDLGQSLLQARQRRGRGALELEQLALNTEPFEPLDGGRDRACRGASPSDNSGAHYMLVRATPEVCKERCLTTPECHGVESDGRSRCELWTRSGGIGASSPVAGYTCLRRTHPGFEPVDGADRACRGASGSDNSRSYYTLAQGALALDECQALCAAAPGCLGVEHQGSRGRCELWTRPDGIGATARVPGFSCWRRAGGPGPPKSGSAFCGEDGALNDFSSRSQMEQGGWSFGWGGEHAFKPAAAQYHTGVPDASYWGFRWPGAGVISLTLAGAGNLTLDYGNSWGQGRVSVYLDGALKDVAEANTPTRVAVVAFQDGDVLKIEETPDAVIVINSISRSCAATPPPPPSGPLPPQGPGLPWVGINGGHSRDYNDSLGRVWHHTRDKWTPRGWGGWVGSRPKDYTNAWGSPRFQCVNWPPEYERDYEPLLHHYSDAAEQTWRVNLQSADEPKSYYTVKWVFCEKNWHGGAKMDFRINGRLVKQDYATKAHHTHTDIYSWKCVPTVDGMIEFRIEGKDWQKAGAQGVQARFSTLELEKSLDGCGRCSALSCNTGMCTAAEFYDSQRHRGAEGDANGYGSERASVSEGECHCADGTGGDACELGFCARVDCNEPFGGSCRNGTCACRNGHSGPDCGVRPDVDEFGCYAESKAATERLTVSRVCLPDRIAGPTSFSNIFRGPSPMHLVADRRQPDVAYFSWTADRRWGRRANKGSEGRIYVSKLRLPRGQQPALLQSTAFDGFVRAGGIDVTDTGVVGTLCAKHWPEWVDDFLKDHSIGYAPMVLAVCEVAAATMAPAGTPWRIGKQFLTANDRLPSTGGWGNYPLAGWWEHRSAGYGWLAYAPKSRSWSAWYGATVGTHTGYAMHTYPADAPRVSAGTFEQYVHPVPADVVESRVENLTGALPSRTGTGDHQAGSAWRYHPLLGDIGLQKHTHWGVYMQQYGLERPSGAFSPPGHSTGRLDLTHGGDEAVQEGSLRPCGDGWITGLVSREGSACARITRSGEISAWRVIEPSVGLMPCTPSGANCGDGRPGGMVRLAPLGSPEEAALCGAGARFLFGYETADRRRWLVELDGDCNELTAKEDVTAHTHWPLYQEWATTADGDVVWVTSWQTDSEGRFGPRGSPNSVDTYPHKPLQDGAVNGDGYLFELTPSATNEAWLTVYRAGGPN